MKNIFRTLGIIAILGVAIACSDTEEEEQKSYASVITPDFSFTEGEIVAGITPVQFTNKTTYSGTEIKEYFWHFGFAGEGNWTQDAEPDPIIFKKTGEFVVTLTAFGEDGNQATIKKTITVVPANVDPVASFTYTPSAVNVGTTVTFTDNSTDSDGKIASREWTMPDGSTSTTAIATYTFNTMGMYNVTLKVTDDRGSTATITKSINVKTDVNSFTVLWSKAYAHGDALVAGNVATVSGTGNIFVTSGEGKLVAFNSTGAQLWSYDAAAKDNVYLNNEISYPGVDTDGSVYWVAHGYGGTGTASVVFGFNGNDGKVLWKNTTAYAPAARIAFSTPAITSDKVIFGSRGTNGAIRAFAKADGSCTASVAPANGGANASCIILNNGLVVFPVSGNYGFGALIPDEMFTWSAVPTANAFSPGSFLSASRCKPCVDSKNYVFVCGKLAGTSGTWNVAAFDCSTYDIALTMTPKWSITLPTGCDNSGPVISADGQTMYLVEDLATPSILYAISTANGAIKWTYKLSGTSKSVPAVDDKGQIHVLTTAGNYVIVSASGTLVTEQKVCDDFEGSVTISEWGYSYVIGKDATSGELKLYAIAVPGVNAPAASAWAQFGQNARHTNCQIK